MFIVIYSLEMETPIIDCVCHKELLVRINCHYINAILTGLNWDSTFSKIILKKLKNNDLKLCNWTSTILFLSLSHE